MMYYYLDLDFIPWYAEAPKIGTINNIATEFPSEPGPDGILSQAIFNKMWIRCLHYRILEEHGPAGGNPLVRVYGFREPLWGFVLDVYEGSRSITECEHLFQGLRPVEVTQP